MNFRDSCSPGLAAALGFSQQGDAEHDKGAVTFNVGGDALGDCREDVLGNASPAIRNDPRFR